MFPGPQQPASLDFHDPTLVQQRTLDPAQGDGQLQSWLVRAQFLWLLIFWICLFSIPFYSICTNNAATPPTLQMWNPVPNDLRSYRGPWGCDYDRGRPTLDHLAGWVRKVHHYCRLLPRSVSPSSALLQTQIACDTPDIQASKMAL